MHPQKLSCQETDFQVQIEICLFFSLLQTNDGKWTDRKFSTPRLYADGMCRDKLLRNDTHHRKIKSAALENKEQEGEVTTQRVHEVLGTVTE